MQTQRNVNHAKPMSEEPLGIGLHADEREGSVRLLNAALANASLLLIKTKKCHWDVAGPQFMTLHVLFDQQYEILATYVDETAERIRMLGGYPLGTAAEYLRAADLKESPRQIPTANECVCALLGDHETITRSIRAAIAQASNHHHDAGTADFLTQMLRGHEKMAWMLRSFSHGQPLAAPAPRTADTPLA